MFFDERTSFESWPEFVREVLTEDRYGCPCCSIIPAALAEESRHAEQLTEPSHWAERSPEISQRVDGLWVNAKIYTMDDSKPFAEAMAIKDGRIVACGSTEALVAAHGQELEVIDAEGRVILPGFIEPHM